IEGGMVCTDDPRLDEILRMLRSHGWAKDIGPDREATLAREREVLEFNRPFTFYLPGFNVRSSDLNARLGLSQMRRADQVVYTRVANHALYQSLFTRADGFRCQHNHRATISSIAFAALASSHEHRERVGEALREAGIETRPLGGGNMSRQPFWSDRYGSQLFPVADRIHETSFQLPNHQALRSDDVRAIAAVVQSVKP
ncbi:MAG: DegT/DnrJ/EryC1/StrS family aminotransferase, partial [Polyangiales bacterium]